MHNCVWSQISDFLLITRLSVELGEEPFSSLTLFSKGSPTFILSDLLASLFEAEDNLLVLLNFLLEGWAIVELAVMNVNVVRASVLLSWTNGCLQNKFSLHYCAKTKFNYLNMFLSSSFSLFYVLRIDPFDFFNLTT